MLEDLLGRDEPLTEVQFEFEPGGGSNAPAAFPIGPPPSSEAIRPESRVTLPVPNAADLAWGFLADDRSVAVLRIDSMMRYREAFEVWRSNGFTANLTDHLSEVVQRATGQSPPEGVDARIALVPSATETFSRLFSAMRDAHTQAMIVDLRRNSGGNSSMNMILGYFLYPLARLLDADGGFQIPRFSKLYFHNYRTASLQRLRSQRWGLLEIGDLDFSEEKAWRDVKKDGVDTAARERRCKEFAQDAARMPTFDVEFRTREASAAWSGKVIVLTSAHTYSAGFDLVAMLAKNGATVIGVPSAQAGNCFIDGLPFHLTNSGLEGDISYKQSLMFPDDPVRGEMLRPEVELTYEKLVALAFDPNASVILALETLRHGAAAH
ncbi:MAG: S41 family peptidase [Deltaproteobacteria bacterium]|nr:S41 family peptidase [Deltaproteobacteria bacterium]